MVYRCRIYNRNFIEDLTFCIRVTWLVHKYHSMDDFGGNPGWTEPGCGD